MTKTRIACICLLAAVLMMAGCARSTYYAGLSDQRDPNAQSLYRDALAKVGAEDHRGAIADLKKAIAVDPNLTEAYRTLSRSYFVVGDYDMALYYRVEYEEDLSYRQLVYNFDLF